MVASVSIAASREVSDIVSVYSSLLAQRKQLRRVGDGDRACIVTPLEIRVGGRIYNGDPGPIVKYSKVQ